MMKQAPIFYVLYDGINNSVFYGQVLEPILKQLQANPKQHIYIISFEKHVTNAETEVKNMPKYPNLKIMICKKNIYICSINLWNASNQLKKILKKYTAYHFIARGPIAGMICKKAINNQCLSFTIQARGLLAQEFLYANAQYPLKKRLPSLIIRIRARQLERIERSVYGASKYNAGTIQAVSPAMKEYLITAFDADPHAITIATEDIPQSISKEQIAEWKHTTRNELNIDNTTTVFCYNGSLKPWQCPEKIIAFFKDQLHTHAHAFLLVLTQDVDRAKKLLTDQHLEKQTYHVMHVAHNEIYRYLSACDVGILFREPHIVNWVSRPTKALEYKSVNLTIAHNNTVAWLTQQH